MRALLFTLISSLSLFSCAVETDSESPVEETGTTSEVVGPIGGGSCMRTGCSGQICSDQQVFTTCEWRPEYACYATATCKRQPNGLCGWSPTPELEKCLENGGGTDI